MVDFTAQGDNVSKLTEPDQFRTFYTAALPRVYGYFYYRLGADSALAEDLTQDTFLAAVAELKRGTTVVAPLPWILGIARHKLLDHLRRQRRSGWKHLPWEGADDVSLRLSDDLESACERALDVLADVPSPQREALVLRYFDGLSVLQVAGVLDRSVSAVESLLARGRLAFRRGFQEVNDAT